MGFVFSLQNLQINKKKLSWVMITLFIYHNNADPTLNVFSSYRKRWVLFPQDAEKIVEKKYYHPQFSPQKQDINNNPLIERI